jgi:hypothetical protein
MTIWVKDNFLAIIFILFIHIALLRKYTVYWSLLYITMPGIKSRWMLKKGTID